MFPNRNQGSLRYRDEAAVTASFMSRVYLWMMVGITITAITAYVIAQRQDLIVYLIQNPLLFWGVIIFQLVLVFILSRSVMTMNVGTASALYALYATLMGVTLSLIFITYTQESIANAFFVTAFAFGGLSLYGYTTKRDLGPIGTFCTMALFGLIGVVLLSLFIPSMRTHGMQMIISVFGVLIFAGLTAYDTQRVKSMQFAYTTSDQSRKGAIFGALILYLDFINLFINILYLTDRR